MNGSKESGRIGSMGPTSDGIETSITSYVPAGK